MNATHTLTKLSICKCGHPVLADDIPLGAEYEHDSFKVDIKAFLQCGGCRERIPVDCLWMKSRTPNQNSGYLPKEIFTEIEIPV